MGTTTLNVQISTRIRISFWAHCDSMVDPKKTRGDAIGFRDSVMDGLKNAKGIDDVSLVDSFTFNEGAKVGFGGFCLNNAKFQESYVSQISGLCHAMQLQCIAGFAVVESGATTTPKTQAFNRWLAAADAAALRGYAAEVASVVNKYGFDGIGFDFELNGLGSAPNHKDNFQTWITELANILAKDNKIVTYANGAPVPPGKDGDVISFMKVQPFALAKCAPNIIARSMMYNGVDVPCGTEAHLKHAIDVALGQVGLHPSQLQLGIKNYKFGGGFVSNDHLQALCKSLLGPNRVGIIRYNLRGLDTDPSAKCVQDLDAIDKALNPGEAPRGTPGQPIQCPVGPAVAPAKPAPGSPAPAVVPPAAAPEAPPDSKEYGDCVPAGKQLHPLRRQIIATGISQVGLVSEVGGSPPGTKKGWEVLMDYWNFGYPDAPPAQEKHVKPATSRPGQWCGVFCSWVLKKAGALEKSWRSKGSEGFMATWKLRTDIKNIVPGDICVHIKFYHHSICTARSGDVLTLVQGNGNNQEITNPPGQKIVGNLQGFYRTVPEDYV